MNTLIMFTMKHMKNYIEAWQSTGTFEIGQFKKCLYMQKTYFMITCPTPYESWVK